MRPRFVLNEADTSAAGRELIDPEAPDASEQMFAASLENGRETPRPRFVVREEEIANAMGEPGSTGATSTEVAGSASPEPIESYADAAAVGSLVSESSELINGLEEASAESSILSAPSEDSWRHEVSARLKRYQAKRRPREPRYPSLGLKFEMPDSRGSVGNTTSAASAAAPSAAPVAASREALAMDPIQQAATPAEVFEPPLAEPVYAEPQPSWPTAKIIEFPGPAYAPPTPLHELADPVIDRPRILEAPEVVPPPPALGGITIEEARELPAERRPGIDMPLQAAPVGLRMLAAAIDLSIVLLACGIFGTIFYQIAGVRPPLWQIVGLGIGLPGVFWMGYQYLLVVYSATTPGLRAAKLELMRFDGSQPSRRRRRARVFASFLSGISLALGYLWQFLDEDALCWHDRVMKTYIAPAQRTP